MPRGCWSFWPCKANGLSRAVGVVDRFELPYEHLSSESALEDRRGWNTVLHDHVVRALDRWDIRAVVFDGVAPYRGLLRALDRRPSVRRVWIRRGLWVRGRVPDPHTAARFDRVIVPGEVGPDDRPADHPVEVAPVTLVDRGMLLARDEARDRLGLPRDVPVLLLALGSGALTDVATPMRAVMDVVDDRGWVVARPRSPLPGGMAPPGLDVRTFEAYPMARLFRAFDGAIAASGYNSFHELVVGEVPSLFVPQPRRTDDQARRARQAADAGLGLWATGADLAAGVEQLLDDDVRARLRTALVARDAVNGAQSAADTVRDLVVSP